MAEEKDLELDDLKQENGTAEAEKPAESDSGQPMAEEDAFPDRQVTSADLEAVYDIPVKVSAVLGKSSMQVNELLKLGRDAVVELDRRVGEPIDIYINDRLVARGEVVVVDERLGITMTEIIKSNRT